MARRTLKEIGREKLANDKIENRAAASLFNEGEPVQYYADGWRFGYVKETAATGYRAGMVRIALPRPVRHGKTLVSDVWAKASDVRKIAKFCRSSVTLKVRPRYNGAQVPPRKRRSSR